LGSHTHHDLAHDDGRLRLLVAPAPRYLDISDHTRYSDISDHTRYSDTPDHTRYSDIPDYTCSFRISVCNGFTFSC